MKARKYDWKLTNFELILNSVLTLNLVLSFMTSGTKYHTDVFSFILFIFFSKFGWPMDFGPKNTVYSGKFFNLVWHSILLTIIITNKNIFALKNLDWNIPMLLFIYFNVMRTTRHLITGLDPIWPNRYADIGSRSDSKKRIIESSDFWWKIIYVLIGLILGVLYLNRIRFFYST